jgi:hypothetical protein
MEISIGEFPLNYKPQPSAGDYDGGYIIRHFVKKINEDKIIEVNNENGNRVNKNIYKLVSLSWRISGPKSTVMKGNIQDNVGVVEQNKFEIDRVRKETSVDLSKVLSNLTEFWRGF